MIIKRAVKIFLTGLWICLLACRGGGEDDATVGEKLGEVMFVESGELRSVKYTVVTVPMLARTYRQQIVWLEEEGTLVEKGDSLVVFESSDIQNSLDNARTNYEINIADLNKLKVDQQTEIDKLSRQIMNARSALQKAVIDTQRVRYESESQKKSARYQWESKKIALEKAKEKLEATKLLQEQTLKIQQLKITQIESRIRELEDGLEGTLIKSPAAGMVVHAVNRRGRERNKVQVGDEVFIGSQLVQLPDLTTMKALTTVNETDINKISEGEPVTVRLDAFPKYSFRGEIIWISNICHEKDNDSKIKVFDVEVLIHDSNPLLKPGMTVNCSFHKITENKDDTAEKEKSGGDDGIS